MGLFFEEDTFSKEGCGSCSLYKPSLKIIPPVSGNNSILVLKSEIDKGEYFRERFSLPDYVTDIIGKVSITSTVKCFLSDTLEKKSITKIEQCCRNHWQSDIEGKVFSFILAYGEMAFKALTGKSNIGLWRQTFIPCVLNGRNVVVYPVLDEANYDDRKKRVIRNLIKLDLRYFMKKKDTFTVNRYLSPDIKHHVSDVHILTEYSDIEQGLERFLHYPEVAIDYETTSLYPTITDDEVILSVSLATENEAIVFPMNHPESPKGVQGLFKSYIGQTFPQKLIAHKLDFEMMWTRSLYINKESVHKLYYMKEWGDTKAKAFAMGIPPGRLSLGDLTKAYFGTDLKTICEIDPVKWYTYPLKKLLFYNGMDALWTARLDKALVLPRWARDEYKHHLKIIPSITEMYTQGISVDPKEFGSIQQKLLETKVLLTDEIEMAVKESGYRKEVNPSSPASLLRWFSYMELDIQNTKEETLNEMKWMHPVIESIMEYKSVMKLKGTYADGLGKLVHVDGKFHPAYSSSSVKSGRLNCKDPNIQQIPKRKAAYVRKIFVPGHDKVFVAMDYAQLEVRVLACVCKDPNLIDYLFNNKDIHLEWAHYIIKRDPHALSRYAQKFKMAEDHPKLIPAIRGEMKSGFVFLSFYGGSAKKCAKMMGVSLDIAEEAQAFLFKKYPKVKEYHTNVWEHYQRTGYVETLTGRRIYGILSFNQAINLGIQGTGSDCTTESGARLTKLSLETGNPNILPRINVHDDNTYCMSREGLEENILICAKEMVTPQPWMVVDFGTEISVGENWYEMKKYPINGKESVITSDFFPDFKERLQHGNASAP